jgi:hypothetical protein
MTRLNLLAIDQIPFSLKNLAEVFKTKIKGI